MISRSILLGCARVLALWMEENDVNPEEVFSWCEKVTAAVLRSVNTVEAGYQLEERLVVLFREGLGMVHEIYSDET